MIGTREELIRDKILEQIRKGDFTDAESLISWLETQEYVSYYKERENVGLCDELRSEIQRIFDENKDILIEFG